MPEAPWPVVERDLDYAATVQRLESRDWAMWNRLNGGGVAVQPKSDGLDAEGGEGGTAEAVDGVCGMCLLPKPSSSEMFDMDL
jgi:hypothetical protein